MSRLQAAEFEFESAMAAGRAASKAQHALELVWAGKGNVYAAEAAGGR